MALTGVGLQRFFSGDSSIGLATVSAIALILLIHFPARWEQESSPDE